MKVRPFPIAFVFLALSSVALPSHASDSSPSHIVALHETPQQITLSNDYLELIFDRGQHKISSLAADHSGRRKFGGNLLASEGIPFSDGASAAESPSRIQHLDRSSEHGRVRITWDQEIAGRAVPVELTFALGAFDRGAHVQVVFPASAGINWKVRVALRQWFLLGLYERGVVQYVAGQQKAFTSRNPLHLFYTMDRENGSVAIVPDDGSPPAETVLLSGGTTFSSGIELRTQPSQSAVDVWQDFSSAAPAPSNNPTSRHAAKPTIAFQLFANDLPYPIHYPENKILGDGSAATDDATAYFTAIYGSAAGVLGSYAEPGSAYPTLATPGRPYGDAFNFFDPDAWSTVTALSYSGDPLLQNEARHILERSESAMRPDGQVPHHFEAGSPTYLSIAKSSQTGPNIFWVIAASDYAAAAGDESWLRAHYAHLRQATDWVLAKYDPQHRLLHADGPLFIDVFRRSGYTLDTNVAALYLLDRMAEVAEFCHDPENVARYRRLRHDLYQGIRAGLWDGRDHFVTQRNLDGSIHDLVDYDGNFAALAFGVPDEADAIKLLQRMDSGAHTHPAMHGTWVSERRYEQQDCYGGNDGDSDVTMARIWWLDMAARVRSRDKIMFGALLRPLEDELLHNVWLPERYDTVGQPAHNDYYHEYPDILTMVLREMRYGIHLGMREVTLRPFDTADFTFQLGKMDVSYSPDKVSVSVPGSGMREFTIAGLHADTSYAISTGKRLSTDHSGALRFSAPSGALIRVTAVERGVPPRD